MASENQWPKVDGDIGYSSDFNRINILSATATITSQDSTASSTYSDSTLTVTLSGLDSNETYTFLAISAFEVNPNANQIITKMVIGSTDTSEISCSAIDLVGLTIVTGITHNGMITGQTGLSSITAKIQFKNQNDSTNVDLVDTGRGTITVFAFPE